MHIYNYNSCSKSKIVSYYGKLWSDENGEFLSIITDIPKNELDQNLPKEIAITSEAFSEREKSSSSMLSENEVLNALSPTLSGDYREKYEITKISTENII